MTLKNAVADTSLAKALTKPYVGPFPGYERPSADECRGVKAALEKLHGPIERLEGPRTNQPQNPAAKSEGVSHDDPGGQEVPGIGGSALTSGDLEIAGVHARLPSTLRKTERKGDIGTPESKAIKRVRHLSPGVENSVQANAVKFESSPDWNESSPGLSDSPSKQISQGLIVETEPAWAELAGSSSVKEEQADLGLGAGHLVESDQKENIGSEALSTQDEFASGRQPSPSAQPRRLSLRSYTRNSQTGPSKLYIETSVDVLPQAPRKGASGRVQARKRKLRDDAEAASQATAPVTPDHLEVGGKKSELHRPQKLELVLSDALHSHSQHTPSSAPSTATSSELTQTEANAPLTLTQALGEQKGSYSGHRSVLDSLVRTILSQNTTDKNSHRAFASLKEAFPTWEDVQAAGQGPLAASIKSGGLAEIKARRILDILDSLQASHGALELEHLRYMSDEQVKAELGRFKGVGPKTVACVLMFCLDRHEFPVDTHVWRISKRLGWVPANADREATYEHLNQRVPDDVKYDLHCLLVGHGKKCPGCAKGGRPQRAPDGPCPLGPWIRGGAKVEN